MDKPEKPKRQTEAQLLKVRVPCVFCGKRLSPKDKKTHACWEEK